MSRRSLQQRANASRAERRESPRVDTELTALLETYAGSRTLTVRNISMSGALLEAGAEPLQSDVRPGAVVQLTLFDANGSASVFLKAQVVRLGGADQPSCLGGSFVRAEEDTARALEGLIVYALVKKGLPDLYRLPVWSDAPLGVPPATAH